MKPSMNYHRRAGNVLQAICAASILGGSTSAQVSQAPAMTTGTAAAAPISVMRESFGTHFSHGRLHAEGSSYLAVFEEGGVNFVPLLGNAVASDRPLRLTFDSTRRSDSVHAVLSTGAASAQHKPEERLVSYARGSVEERYHAERDGLEQSFLFRERPEGSGDLIVRLRVETQLVGDIGQKRETLRFREGQIGGVEIGAITGIDAGGRAQKGHMNFDGQFLELVLPEAFVQNASYPMVLDPLIGTYVKVSNATASDNNQGPAIAAGYGKYLVVWERRSSSSNSYIRGRMLDASGKPTGGILAISDASLIEVESRPSVGAAALGINFAGSWFFVAFESARLNFPGGISGVAIAPDGSVKQQIPISLGGSNPDVGDHEYRNSSNIELGFTVVFEDLGNIRATHVPIDLRNGGIHAFGLKTRTIFTKTGVSKPKINTFPDGGKSLVVWNNGAGRIGSRFIAWGDPILYWSLVTVFDGAPVGGQIDDIEVDGDTAGYIICWAWRASTSTPWQIAASSCVPPVMSNDPITFRASKQIRTATTDTYSPVVAMVGSPNATAGCVIAYTFARSGGVYDIGGSEHSVDTLSRFGPFLNTNIAPQGRCGVPALASERDYARPTGRSAVLVWRAQALNSSQGDVYAQAINACAYVPVFSEQPVNANLDFGYNRPQYVFTVDSPDAINYQWYFNGNPLAGKTDKRLTLSISNATAALAGSYYCEIDACGAPVRSNTVSLTVGPRRTTRNQVSVNEGAFGTRVLGIGDFDGDGYEDFAMSDATANTAGPNTGLVSIVSGRTLGRIVDRRGVGLRNNVGSAGALFGRELAAGDFDDDGRADVLISAPSTGPGSAIHLLRGKTGDVVGVRASTTLELGAKIAAGRIDARAGTDYVFTERQDGLNAYSYQPDARLWYVVPVAGVAIGSLAVIGDVNGDGYGDVGVGLPSHGSGAGRYEIRSGRDGSLLLAHNGGAREHQGGSVVAIGDVNGDRVPDMLVSNPGEATRAGSIELVSGSNGASLGVAVGVVGFGQAIAAAGDYNLDGTPDVMVTTSTSQGNVVEIRSGKSLATVLHRLESNAGRTLFGRSLASLDSNGDGLRDWLVSEPIAQGGSVFHYARDAVSNPPKFDIYGRSGPGTAGRLPRISGGLPLARIAGNQIIELSSARANSAAILRLAIDRIDIPLDALGMVGSALLVNTQLVDWVLPTDGLGRSRFVLPLSSNPAYAGVTLRWQWYVLDPGLNTVGLTASDAAEMTIGAKR